MGPPAPLPHLGFNMILGILGYIGVGLNGSIVVLAETDQEDPEATGEPVLVQTAVVNVLRHVHSTTITTMGGFLPLLLLAGGDFWPSLAIVLAAGIPFATLLSIGFVPAASIFVMRLSRARARARPTGWPRPRDGAVRRERLFVRAAPQARGTPPMQALLDEGGQQAARSGVGGCAANGQI